MHSTAHTNAGKLLTALGVLIVLAGCANTAPTITSTDELAGTGDRVVFGQVQLIRNGTPVQFGDGLMANTAVLNIYDPDSNRKFVGKLGEDGEFSWALPSGTYEVESVAFRMHGQTVEPETSFTFTVSPDFDATYLGTVKIEGSFNGGYAGVTGTVDRFVVQDNCASDCQRRLDQLGMTNQASTSSLFRWDQQ